MNYKYNNFYFKNKYIMAIIKYNPRQNSLMNFFNDDLFDDFFKLPSLFDNSILNDVSNTDKEFKVEFMLPGFKKEEVKLEINNDVLSISAERKENKYFNKINKSYSLPENLDTENVEAKLEDGVLKILIPKLKEEKVEAKVIEIQ